MDESLEMECGSVYVIISVGFPVFDSELTTDSIATIPIKEHTLENAPNTPVINSQKNITKEVTKDTDEVIVANVVKPAEELITKQTVQQRLKKDIETTSKKRERIANYVAPKQAIENVTVTVENQQLASQQTNNHLIEPSIPQREKIIVELLEIKSIALLDAPTDFYTTAINFKPTTNNLIANAETPKKRTLKSLIGKLPGNGVKISIIPSFFTD